MGDREVKGFHSANAALLALQTEQPCDLLITDIFMPDMDGLELIMNLTGIGFHGGVAIVCGVSIETLQVAQTIANGTGLKFRGPFFKPVTTEQLRACIDVPESD